MWFGWFDFVGNKYLVGYDVNIVGVGISCLLWYEFCLIVCVVGGGCIM